MRFKYEGESNCTMVLFVSCQLYQHEESADICRLLGGSGMGQRKGVDSGGKFSIVDEEDS
jgi:hypothetical protein